MSETDPVVAPPESATIDSSRFREVLGHFLTGVVVVTAVEGGEPVGMTCQSLASLSIDPPLVLFCPAKSSTTWPRMRRSETFCMNILNEEQRAIAEGFARSGGNKFDGVAFHLSDRGSPVLDGVLAYIDCTIDAVHEGGDHYIVVGRVLDVGVGRVATPLVFFRGDFRLS